ncbi:MAG TPA: extracellular solute-binding protein [Actinomycetota bacterium]|nr:extracellular solute-binding protein [Actinomycetota bacterium]
MFTRSKTLFALGIVLCLVGAACGGEEGATEEASTAKGPIDIWYSDNPEEIAWGKKVVADWNKGHPEEKVTGEQIPAGETSEEVIGAAITAGNTPCLVFNTAPAAVPGFQQQGGLVSLSGFSDGDSYIEERAGKVAQQYKSPDGSYYQMPWKLNPVMIFYNKDVFQKAGLDPENPPLNTYDEFIQTSHKLVDKGGVTAAIWPAPTSEFFQSWFDFYPLFIAESGGKQLVEGTNPQFTSEDGMAVADFWSQMYDQGLSQKEVYNGDAFADGKSAMAIVGPWAIAVYGDDVNWGVSPVPTAEGVSPEETYTFSDEKSVGMYSACENQGTAWDFLKFATSKANDGELLETTGQMPMRTDITSVYADFFKANPESEAFADQAKRVAEVPNVPNSIEMWQDFRDAYSESVIFGKSEPEEALRQAADSIQQLVSEE